MAKLVDKYNKNVRVCRRCGRFFEYHNIGYGLCPSCTQIDNEIFQRVKDYLVDHGTATAPQISEALEISESTIYRYLRDGRIEIPENSPIYIKCEICHGDIRYGRYCPDCAINVKKELNKGIAVIDRYEIGEKPKNKTVGKMHTYEPRVVERK